MTTNPKGPLGKAILRKFVRVIFRLIGALRALGRRRAGDAEGLPWQVKAILWLAARGGDPTAMPPKQFRRGYRLHTALFHVDDAPMAEVKDFAIRDGLSARLYRPHSANTSSPALVYFHGGGFVIGDLETHDTFCRYVADRAKIAVIAVDYRLAPEHKYPAQAEDAIYAFNWAHDNAEALGLDPDCIGAGGDSAGGLITMVLGTQALQPTLQWTLKQPPAFLWAIYPAVDRRTRTASHNAFDRSSNLMLTTPLMEWFMAQTLPEGADPAGPAISPAAAERLDGLPPTFVLTVEFDPLRDEGAALVNRLAAEGVRVVHHFHPRLLHEFISMGGVVPEARQALDQAINVLGDFTGTE